MATHNNKMTVTLAEFDLEVTYSEHPYEERRIDSAGQDRYIEIESVDLAGIEMYPEYLTEDQIEYIQDHILTAD